MWAIASTVVHMSLQLIMISVNILYASTANCCKAHTNKTVCFFCYFLHINQIDRVNIHGILRISWPGLNNLKIGFLALNYFVLARHRFSTDTWHMEAEKRWTPFRRWHFHVHFLQWKLLYLIKFSLKCVRKGPIDNKSSIGSDNGLVPIRRKPLSEPMMISFPTHKCVIFTKWFSLWIICKCCCLLSFPSAPNLFDIKVYLQRQRASISIP